MQFIISEEMIQHLCLLELADISALGKGMMLLPTSKQKGREYAMGYSHTRRRRMKHHLFIT